MISQMKCSEYDLFEKWPSVVVPIHLSMPSNLYRFFLQVRITISNNQHVPVVTDKTIFTVSIGEAFLSSCRYVITQVIARDEDDGIDGEISYELLEIRPRYEEKETLLTVAATDGGTPSFSVNTTITVAFSTPCLVQHYIAEPRTGIIYGLLMCSIDIQPIKQNVIISSNFLVTCTVISNLPGATISLLHNSTYTIAERVPLSKDNRIGFERFNSKFVDAGYYQCKLNTSIGIVLSNISTLSIATYGIYMFKCCSVCNIVLIPCSVFVIMSLLLLTPRFSFKAISSQSLIRVSVSLAFILFMLVLAGALLDYARGIVALYTYIHTNPYCNCTHYRLFN